MQCVQECVPGMIVRYSASSNIFGGVEDLSSFILDRVFWFFKLCTEGFKCCKPVMQVDDTFSTGKCHVTLLNVIAQDENWNMFLLLFAIVEDETNEAWMWFCHLLRTYVTPQQNLCITSNKGSDLLSALRSQEVGWNASCLKSMYCIQHIASNFNKRFHNVNLKRQCRVGMHHVQRYN